MKKILSVVLSAIIILSICTFAFAADTQGDNKLSFGSDGKFTILMINDSQDVGSDYKQDMITFLKKSIETANPDLIVFDGDQLADYYPMASLEDCKKSISNICTLCQEKNIPFAVTLGNHDHDRENKITEDEQFEAYSSFSCCLNKKGYDNFTFNVPIYSSDQTRLALNIYMMDSNNTVSTGYEGVNAQQVQWYKDTSDSLKAQNGGNIVPSLLFQHVPVKEIYYFLKECSWNEKGAIFSRRDNTWYKLDESKVNGGVMGEAPCSENFDRITGEYQAFVEKGDIIGAWFAHDHLNTFDGVTAEGIRLGYNGGAGFRAYGNGDNRCVRVFELDENNVSAYETHLLYYKDLIGDKKFVFIDLITPVWLTWIMKGVYAVISPILYIIDMFKK